MSENIRKARELINEAYAIIITSGAGMGVDSGLPDFRGNEGFWKAYPPVAKLGYEFQEMANPSLFESRPKLAWGFYGHRLKLYRDTIPHEGFKLLLDLVKSKDDNYFVFTSNVDGQFQKAGFDSQKIYEVHGSIHHLQCTDACTQSVWSNKLEDIKINMQTLEAQTLPECEHCNKLSRPNILMFDDWSFIGKRTDSQARKFHNWTMENKGKKIVIIEIGAGSAVPTIRSFGDRFSRTEEDTTLIRINPREYDVLDEKNISIASAGFKGIKQVITGK